MTAPLPPIDLDVLMQAYARGIFPMADSRSDAEVYWVEPRQRGILPLDQFHLSKSLARRLKSNDFRTTADAAFDAVVRACADTRESTWINRQIEQAVTRLHQLGQAHSVEAWRDGELVGGLYGIRLGRAFFGESMFSTATDASKVALAHLVARLRLGGFELLDCQFITPHLASLGAIEISRSDYLARLESATSPDRPQGDYRALDSSVSPAEALMSPPRTTVVSGPISGCRILQSLAQTS